MSFRIDRNTVAVVTGAAGGIGLGVATELAGRGARLALVDLDAAGLESAQLALAGRSAGISIHRIDVADRDAMAALPDEVIAHHGAVHLLVNNAGVSVAAPVERLPIEDADWLMGINFWGTVYGCSFFLPHLRRAGRAAICNVLSDFALFALPTKSFYCASKYALRGFSESLRAELRGSGVSLTCVYPGPVATGLVRNGRAWDAGRRDAEERFVASRAIPMEKVVAAIVRGVERERRRVLIGAGTRAIDLAARISPAGTQALVERFWKRIDFL